MSGALQMVAGLAGGITKVITTTGAITFMVPDGIYLLRKVRCYGPGANGYNGAAGSGGGGGAYAEIENIAVIPGQSISGYIGAGNSGLPTWFISDSTVRADAAQLPIPDGGADGGRAEASVGTLKLSGGSGGSYAVGGQSAGGGGGAAGPNGPGRNGGDAAMSPGGLGMNGGGGGANGGSAGSPGVTSLTGGDGGNGRLGSGGGLGRSTGAAGNGSDGGGGGGVYNAPGNTPGAGGTDAIHVDSATGVAYGPGGGGGGGYTGQGASGGGFGGGGGGHGGAGRAGGIVLEY